MQALDRSNRWLEKIRFYFYDVWETDRDFPVRRLPFMQGGPWAILLLVAFYLYLSKDFGPKYMKKRNPLRLQNVIFWYDVFMVILNGFLFVSLGYYTRFGYDCWTCRDVEKRGMEEELPFKIFIGWLYMASKLVDLLDTGFFVLRKKFDHVSTLHVFHHSIMPIVAWIGAKYAMTETAALLPLMNSFVHAVMYSYYALSSLGPKVRPYLWWKRYLTMTQIVQIVVAIFHCFYACLRCGTFSSTVGYLLIPQGFILLAMFCAFFSKAYVKQTEAKKMS